MVRGMLRIGLRRRRLLPRTVVVVVVVVPLLPLLLALVALVVMVAVVEGRAWVCREAVSAVVAIQGNCRSQEQAPDKGYLWFPPPSFFSLSSLLPTIDKEIPSFFSLSSSALFDVFFCILDFSNFIIVNLLSTNTKQ